MDSVAKTFHHIPLHVNPIADDDDEEEEAWLCDLKFLSSTACPTCVFSIGLDDPSTCRYIYCTSLNVSVKEVIVLQLDNDIENSLALHFQRQNAVIRRQNNAAIGKFLHGLSLSVTDDKRLEAFMLFDDNDDDDDSPGDNSTLNLVMHIEFNQIINSLALETGIISNNEEVEYINLNLNFSCISRPAHVASLAIMMAAHERLGSGSALGCVLGVDMLRLVCRMYQLRLYECRRGVWSE